MEIRGVLAEAASGIRRARSIEPRSWLELSALRWELYAVLQNVLDAMAMMVADLSLRKPSTYAGLGAALREAGLLSEEHYELVRGVAAARNVLAHAYRRMDRGDLRRLAEGLLPRVADPIDALARIAEERGLDPPNPSGQLFRVFERHGVVLAYLFGSRARGTARRGSDYDFAVLFARDDVSVEEEIALALGLAEALGVPSDKVDVVALNRADPELIARVLKEGKLLYARSEDERRRWERGTLLELLRLSDLTAVYAARALKHVKRVGSRAEGQAPHS